MSDCPIEYLEFEDETDYVKDRYEEDTLIINSPNCYINGSIGQIKKLNKRGYLKLTLKNSRYSISKGDRLIIQKTNRDIYSKVAEAKKVKNIFSYKYSTVSKKYFKNTKTEIILEVCPKEDQLKKISVKEKYKSIEEYATDYLGLENRNGRFGYEYNPNSKWDWYEIGGRWQGLLKLKENAQSGKTGSLSILQKLNNENISNYDSALFGDIDFDSMKKEEAEKYKKIYEVYEQSKDVEKKHMAFIHEIYPHETKEEYVNRKAVFTTFAILKDGVWHEQGEMGFFAIVSNEKGKDEWEKEYQSLLGSITPNERVTIVDCHI